ncbi:MAG TPA: ATP-binding protein [Candidatus Binataceae bacterium]|nr:ATP-binding protein [Candidatus Binataceae bacterium]
MRNRHQLPKRERLQPSPEQTSRRRKSTAAARPRLKAVSRLQATDAPIEATPEEIDSIRGELGTIEKMLAALFGAAYDRGPVSMAARARAADLIESQFEKIVEEWCRAVEQTFDDDYALHRPGMANALVRFVAHLRDPDDIRTYIYLRRHCQEGMLSRAKPSQFNIFHIALKQVLLNHVRKRMRSRSMEVVRDTVVAAIDERRLMVCQFYIESRESALRASEDKYRSSIDHAPDPMYEIDPATLVVIGANSAALELHRILPYEQDMPLIGQPLYELTPGEMRPIILKHIRTVINSGSAAALDLPIRGRYFDVNSALIPTGSRPFIQMILHDVTQRHEMLDTLLKAERLAAAGTFASGVAHEVNNPMASISSLVQSLLPGEAEAERVQTLRTILSQINRIATTLKDLVNFARPAPAERKMLDLNDMISETLRLVAYNKRFGGIRIEPALSPDLMPAFADQNGIQQVLLNLLFNAADAACHEGGVIRVITENKQRPAGDGSLRVVMRVVDNGCGIAPENVERVFDPFFTTKPAGSGVGLGLSLCQRIVLNNQGTIRMQSEIGAGTTVAISLPVYTESAAAAMAAPATAK